MGLISRVSSRTYREKVMNARLLNVGRRFQSMMDKAKKAFDEPIKGGANFRGGYKSHADRYGVRTYSLRELTETKSDYRALKNETVVPEEGLAFQILLNALCTS